jgi:hypothetical protein
MEARLNPLRTGTILLDHINDNAEAKGLRAEAVSLRALRLAL